ncbi:MAG: CHAD domain-containing protein [Chloroflexota bacterium]
MERKETFDLSGRYTEQDVIEELSNHHIILQDASTAMTAVFLDTFDWRLFNASFVLHQSGQNLILRDLKTNQILEQQSIEARPTFIEDFPLGSLQLRLASIIEMRALLPITIADLQSSTYRVLNKDAKTVVRLTYETVQSDGQSDDQATISHLHVHPIRGYDKPMQKLKVQLKKMGAEPDLPNISRQALAWSSRTPGGYSAKIDLPLKAKMRADEATKLILQFLLQIIKRNEFGIKQDIDTEFLHDFRVAIRRKRSALAQIKGVFPEETVQQFKQDLSYIGKLTGELRDLDVYLLAEASYKDMLPPQLQTEIEPLFAYLKRKRAAALKRVSKDLNGQKYADILQTWEDFLNEPKRQTPTAPNAKQPIIVIARHRIYRKYGQIIKEGQRILQDVNMVDEELHDLRIECKKLRYLLEFFSNLFPKKALTLLTKQLKVLQNNLGDFNDLCVQEDYLMRVTDEMGRSRSSTASDIIKVNRAIGALIGVLHQEREREKAEFAETFTRFSAPTNQARFKQLFAAERA